MDNHPNGKISKSKFKQITKEAFPSVNSDRLSNHIFKVYDSNNDSFISFDELLTVIYISSSGSPEENLKLIFNIFDTNKDGLITKRELKKIFR